MLHPAPRDGAETPPAIEVELMKEVAHTKGEPSQAAPQQQQPAPVTQTVPQGNTVPEGNAGAQGTAGSTPPRMPAPPRPPARAAVNLGGADEDVAPLIVIGANVVPPRPDVTTHNRPPFYPPEAARRGAQGVVHLIVHVTESGLPAWIDVARSSGDAALDRAARDAVAQWRFRPARQDGAPVAFDYEQAIRFTLGGR